VGEVIQKVIKTIPHDDRCFTQGLVYDSDGTLYESCGLYGKSSLRIIDRDTGKVRKRIALPSDVFAEGLTVHNNILYLLTWKNKKMFMYSKADLSYLGVRRFESSTSEGWGLTSDGKVLYVSDGSESISVYNFPQINAQDAQDTVGSEAHLLQEVHRYKVYDPITGRHINLVNELEFHNGNIYANLWYKDVILRFNATTGRINERYDATKLYPKMNRAASADCLNGIAYDPLDDTMLLTGKKWPKYYKVNFTEMDIRRQMEL
jgi:glutamine cyclotransferase